MLAAIDLGDESVVEASLRDLTDRKKMERQLMIADRLSMVGRMTAGVAHEINNPLEGIANYLALLERESTPPEKRKKYLENVRHGFHLIRDIVRDLSAIARPEPEHESPDLRSRRADLTQVVARATAISAHATEMKSVEVRTVGLDHPFVVVGDERRLEQVFLNLFLNAGRAMGGAGQITVTATAVSADGAGDLIEVAVEDEGTGIPEENLTKIFDPFFTTARGGGMGLFVSYGIVRAHGGDLVAENRAPRGARFLLRLPAMIEDEVQ
jgi:signal transduction histidine kinase